jgi:hypothetical protein
MRIQQNRKKKKKSAWHLHLKPQRRPIWKNSDIPITQIGDEVKDVVEDRLQSFFRGHFSTLIRCLLTILLQIFIIGVNLQGKNCTHIVHIISYRQ